MTETGSSRFLKMSPLHGFGSKNEHRPQEVSLAAPDLGRLTHYTLCF